MKLIKNMVYGALGVGKSKADDYAVNLSNSDALHDQLVEWTKSRSKKTTTRKRPIRDFKIKSDLDHLRKNFPEQYNKLLDKVRAPGPKATGADKMGISKAMGDEYVKTVEAKATGKRKRKKR